MSRERGREGGRKGGREGGWPGRSISGDVSLYERFTCYAEK